MSSDQRRAALRAFLKERGLNVHGIASDAGVSDSTIRGFLSGRNKSMNASTLEAIARSAGASVSELFGEAERREPNATIKILSYVIGDDGRLAVEQESAGAGVPWKKAWIDRYLDGRSNNGRIIEIAGDSFADELRSGDFVCIHLGRTDPAHDPGIYCLHDGASLHLRRMQAMPGKIYRLMSDNPRYAAIDVPAAEVQIVGRAVWRAGAI